MRETSPPKPKALPGEMVMISAVALVAVLTLLAFPYRADYAGHFLGGAGATILLLGLVAAFFSEPRPWVVLGLCLTSVALGVGTEATIFRLAAYDWVDFAFQSAGAVLVTAPFLDGGGGYQASRRVGWACFAMLVGSVVLVSV